MANVTSCGGGSSTKTSSSSAARDADASAVSVSAASFSAAAATRSCGQPCSTRSTHSWKAFTRRRVAKGERVADHPQNCLREGDRNPHLRALGGPLLDAELAQRAPGRARRGGAQPRLRLVQLPLERLHPPLGLGLKRLRKGADPAGTQLSSASIERGTRGHT